MKEEWKKKTRSERAIFGKSGFFFCKIKGEGQLITWVFKHI